uniref:Uncharacterized protein n=1 Tax=Heterorhabditis bacteriophora TaxID=37862 RepID=A0A1I7W905_HETBA
MKCFLNVNIIYLLFCKFLKNSNLTMNVHKTISNSLIKSVNATKIKQNLRRLTKEPHLAGSDANKRVAYEIADMWIEAGLEGLLKLFLLFYLSLSVFINSYKLVFN